MTVFLGIDDTDSLESIGTGRLARKIADTIADKYQVKAVTRHQLLVHPDIPYTSHNSSAVIWLDDIQETEMVPLFELVIGLIRENFVEGSDPGIVLAHQSRISAPVITFGQDAKRLVLTREQALILAHHTGILMAGIGGTEGGVIGALAGIGLATTGYDGRFLQYGKIRDMPGDQDVADILGAGITQVVTTDGRLITEGRIKIRKFPQPACIGGEPVLLVEEIDGELTLVKRD